MDRSRTAPHRTSVAGVLNGRARWVGRRLALLSVALIALLGLASCSDSAPSPGEEFVGLTGIQRVYDQTGVSLTPEETTELERRLDALWRGTGADVVVYVRELDADSDDTLEQVEALQQAWVAVAGIDQDTAGAILINREPGAADEARAGIFVGTTYDDGNVPRDEQKAIVENALVPPLREGDVAGSLAAGIDRLESSIRNGPPKDEIDHLAAGAGSTWLPWTGLGAAVAGLLGVALLFRRRALPTGQKPLPTTARPDHDTEPALAAALVIGTAARPHALPATVLALATRGALVIEPDPDPELRAKGPGRVQIRLLDEGRVRGEVEQTVWDLLTARARRGLVSSRRVRKLGADLTPIRTVIDDRLQAEGWLAAGTAGLRAALGGLAGLGAVLMLGGLVVVGAGAPLMLITAVPAALLFVLGITAAAVLSRLSVAGRDAALPWEAYRDGLKASAKNARAELDLDAVLPDIVALGLAPRFQKQLDAATDPGNATTVRAFTSTAGDAVPAMYPWGAFSSSFAASSSGGGGTASGGGSGGGGGAAGST